MALPPLFEALLRAFERHLAAGRGLSPHTVRAYVGDAASMLAHVGRCGIEEVAEMDISVIRAWLATQHAARHSRASIARRAASARALTAFAHERGMLATDPGALLGTLKTRRELPEILAVDEMQAVLGSGRGRPAGSSAARDRAGPGDRAGAIEFRDTAIMELLYATGIRVGELCGLDVDDVDQDRRTIRVLGKGAKERVVPFGVPAGRAVARWRGAGRPRLARDLSGPALFLGGATYIGFLVAKHDQVDATAPLVAVLLLLCGELSAWSLDERWEIRADEALAWRRGAALGILALAGLAVSALLVALSAVPSSHGLAWTVAGSAAAVGAAGTGVWVARR